MKAIGAKNSFILGLFMSEALLIGLIGSTLAILVGGGGAYIMTGLAPVAGPGGGVRHMFLLSLFHTIFLMSGFFQYF